MSTSDPLESKFRQKVVKDLDSLRNTFWFSKEAAAIRGLPDIIACVNGHFVALELKRNKKEATKKAGRIVLQRYNINKINRSGGDGFIVCPETWDVAFSHLLWLSDKKK